MRRYVYRNSDSKKRIENLKGNRGKPFASGREAPEMGRKGGFASAKKRQEKRTYKEIAAALLPEKPSQCDIDYVLSKFPYINTQEITVKMMMVLGLCLAM